MCLQLPLLVVLHSMCSSSSSSSKAKLGMVSSGCLLKARSLLHRLGHAWLCHSSKQPGVWQLRLRCSMWRRRLRNTQQQQQQQQQQVKKAAARALQGTLPSGSASSDQHHVSTMPEKTVQTTWFGVRVARRAAALSVFTHGSLRLLC
jgi:hypothetical protein